MDADGPFLVHPIGRVRSPCVDRHAVPIPGCPAAIEVLPAYAPALDGIERGSHLSVLAWLHEADRDVLVARPRRIDPEGAAFGVFASRSPARPNPIGLSVTRLVRRAGLVLEVDPLDLIDGTPVLDLKSYSPGWDGVFCARPVRRVPPDRLDDASLRSYLARDLANHLGDAAAHPAAQAALDAVFAAVRRTGLDPRDPRLRVRVNRLDGTTDALIGLLGATLASGRIVVAPDAGPLRIEFEGEASPSRSGDR